MNLPTRDELNQYLREIRASEGPVSTIGGHVQSKFAPAFCSAERAGELMKVSNRPPRGFKILKFGSRSVVGSHTLRDGSETVLKYYYPKHFHKHLTYGIYGSRCDQSWVAALAFRFVDLPTPAPWVIHERKLLGDLWLSKSFLATGHASGDALDDWVLRHHLDAKRLETMADQLQRLFSRMADYQIAHGDLKANNLLVSADDSVSFVDLDAANVLAPVSKWTSLRGRDERIFQANWAGNPRVAAAFSKVFRHAAT